MALNPTGAKTTLGNLFANPVGDEASARSSWKSAIQTLTAAVVPASTTVAAAAATFETAITGFNAPSAAQASLEAALVTFAATVGTGMAPAFVATPPVAPVGLSFPTEDNAQDAADAIIDTINTWLKTGTAVPSGGGPPVNWS